MVDRREVEELLAACEMIRDHELDPVKYSPIVPAPELAALCHAWLAVDEAPVMQIGGADGLSAFLIRHGKPTHRELQGQRVRIVKQVG